MVLDRQEPSKGANAFLRRIGQPVMRAVWVRDVTITKPLTTKSKLWLPGREEK